MPDYIMKSLKPWLRNPSKAIEQPAMTTWGRGNYTLDQKSGVTLDTLMVQKSFICRLKIQMSGIILQE